MAGTHRLPREAFIAKIARVVERMEATLPSIRVRWTWPAMLGGGEGEARLSFESLHVFGSFARGAPFCADLDLLIGFAWQDGPRPLERAIRAHCVSRIPNVGEVLASQAELPRLLERFPESLPLWSPTERDWRARVAAIPLDPTAGHFERRTDQLPVALHQLNFHNHAHLEAVLDAIDANELASTWVPLEQISPAPETWSRELQRLAGLYADRFGRRTREVLPFVLEWMARRLDTPVRARAGHDRATLHINDLHAHIGRPSVDVALLERTDVSTIILAPHRTARTPSGLWALSRTSKHRAVTAFAPLNAWIEADKGRPLVIPYWNDSAVLPSHLVELFPDARSAQDLLQGRDADGVVPEVGRLRGGRLLDLLAKVEVVLVGEDELRVDHGSAEQLATALRTLLLGASKVAADETK
jgi:hypothetical protein